MEYDFGSYPIFRAPVQAEKRAFNKPPSLEMMDILATVPSAVLSQRGGICDHTPTNFLGSLGMALLAEVNVHELTAAGFRVPQVVSKPVEVRENVAITIYDEDPTKVYLPTGKVAPLVLNKTGVGKEVGVVLEGPLAGLVLRPHVGEAKRNTREDLQEGMCVNRIWNDRLSCAVGKPYRPYMDLEKDPLRPQSAIDRNNLAIRRRILGVNTVINWFQKDPNSSEFFEIRIYQRLLSEHRRKIKEVKNELGREPLESEVFFRLCQMLNIPVDQKSFQTTLSEV